MDQLNHCEVCKKMFINYNVDLSKEKLLYFCRWECYKEHKRQSN